MEYFIPFRLVDVIAMCADDLPDEERPAFAGLTTVLTSLVHQRFHACIEALKDAYAPFDVDADTRVVDTSGPPDRAAARQRVEEELAKLAEAANFIPIDTAEVTHAFREHALLKVRMAVDHSPVAKMLLFRRGETTRTQEVRSWFGLRRQTVTYTNYARVLIYASFREDIEARGHLRPGAMVVKLFRDVARDDLEMVLPGLDVRMRLIDKLLIGVPAAATGAIVIATKVIVTVGLIVALIGFWLGLREHAPNLNRTALVTIIGGLVAIGSYLFRQITKFKNRKIRFMKAVSENLYFHNLDNEAGVFHHILDEAEEAELKETVLAYHHLRMARAALAPAELDKRVEEWFATRRGVRFDFEIADGVRNLLDFGLATRDEAGHLSAVPLQDGRLTLDRAWVAVFDPATTTPPDSATEPAG